MDHNTPTVKTVRVLLPNFDERQYAIFRMAFKMHNTTHYQLLADEDNPEPELVLVDGDAQGGCERWQQARRQFAQAKVVYFATQPPDFTAPYLAKPIRFDTLFNQLRNLLQGNGVWVADTQAAVAEFTRDVGGGVQIGPAVDAHQRSVQAASSQHNPPDSARRHESVTIRRFSSQGRLLGLVQQLLAQDQHTIILVGGKPILVIFPTLHKVLLAVPAEKIQTLCAQAELALQTRPVPAGEQKLHEKAKIQAHAFVWQVAIWTAQGRLMDPITPDTVLKLKSWPNMTRMAYLPEGLRLSAFLVKTPASLSMLYKMLPLNIEDIINYIAAAYATGYLQVQDAQVQNSLQQHLQQHEAAVVLGRTVPEAPVTSDVAAAKSEKRPPSLLQRLIRRLRGK